MVVSAGSMARRQLAIWAPSAPRLDGMSLTVPIVMPIPAAFSRRWYGHCPYLSLSLLLLRCLCPSGASTVFAAPDPHELGVPCSDGLSAVGTNDTKRDRDHFLLTRDSLWVPIARFFETLREGSMAVFFYSESLDVEGCVEDSRYVGESWHRSAEGWRAASMRSFSLSSQSF